MYPRICNHHIVGTVYYAHGAKPAIVKILMKTLSNCRFYINSTFVSGIRLVNSIFRLDIRLTFCMDTKIVSRLRLINTIFRFKVQVLKL